MYKDLEDENIDEERGFYAEDPKLNNNKSKPPLPVK